MSPASGRFVVCRNVANVHAEPGGESEVVTQALYGEKLEMIESRGEWALVRCPDDYTGWMASDCMTVPQGTPYEGLPDLRVNSLFEPLLIERDGVLMQETILTLGTEVRITGARRGSYAKVLMPDGRSAWIRHAALSEPPSSCVQGPAAVLETAHRFMGVPYLWGGRSSFGLDCSGFTQRVYEFCGLLLPRDAFQQAAWEPMRPVGLEDAEPGDLAFFGGDHDPRGRGITHVGILLDRSTLIHSAGGRGVCIVPLSQGSDLRRRLVAIGRPFPSPDDACLARESRGPSHIPHSPPG